MIKSIEVVIYNVVGGIGSIVGPIIGVGVMVPLPEFLRGFVAYQIALYGLILILILRFFPAGIWGTARRVIRSLTHVAPPPKLKPLSFSIELARGFSIDFGNIIGDKKETLLECKGISRDFGGLAALSEVSFSISRGDILGIVGPNGAGKTTLYNLITGVFPPNRGTIIFKGKNIAGLKPSKINRQGIARVFQTRVLYTEASVKENVARALFARSGVNGIKDLLGVENKKHQWSGEQTQQILKLCGLDSVAEELPKNLPHGFQRLVGLGIALASKPELMLLDEPVTGMSFEEMDIIADILEKLHQSGLTIAIVEHNVNFVMRLCRRIMVLNYGEKIAEGTPGEISSNPKVIEAFLGGLSDNP
jgi:ABC-type branched-subunit amino acid transport system ATPase component